jgi:hypothetical protein
VFRASAPQTTPAQEPFAPAAESEHIKKIRGIVEDMLAAYAQPPPAICSLQALLASDEAHQLSDRLDDLWLDALRHHTERHIMPPRTVIRGFLSLRGLVD